MIVGVRGQYQQIENGGGLFLIHQVFIDLDSMSTRASNDRIGILAVATELWICGSVKMYRILRV